MKLTKKQKREKRAEQIRRGRCLYCDRATNPREGGLVGWGLFCPDCLREYPDLRECPDCGAPYVPDPEEGVVEKCAGCTD